MKEPFATLISSGIASLTVYPLDVIKSYRVNSIYTGENAGIKNILQRIRLKGGMGGFYRGVSAHLMTYPVFWTVYFSTEEFLRGRYTMSWDPMIPLLGIPIVSSVCASFVANPLFVIKARLQTNLLVASDQGIMSTIAGVSRDGKYGSAFMRGFPATAASSLKLVIQMPLCEVLRDAGVSTIVAAACANIGTAAITYPLEYVRVNQRISKASLNMSGMIKSAFWRDGKFSPRGVYRGIGSYLMVSCPNFVIMMWLRSVLRDT